MRSNTNAECGSVRLSLRCALPGQTTPKSELRKAARQRRAELAHPDIGAALAAHAIQLKLKRDTVVGGYHALPGEADPALLLQALVTRGCHIAFPRIAAKNLPLEFHLVPDEFYKGGEVLKRGPYGIHEPAPHWPMVIPHLLLVPLLAFDKYGHRLGYGGGFYDRTIAALKSGAGFPLRAIGIAYCGQEVESLPHEPHDMVLDAILTERGLTTHTE